MIICRNENCERAARINDLCRTCYLYYVRFQKDKRIPVHNDSKEKTSLPPPIHVKKKVSVKSPTNDLLSGIHFIRKMDIKPAYRDILILNSIMDVTSYAKKYKKTETLITIFCKKGKITARKFGYHYVIYEPSLGEGDCLSPEEVFDSLVSIEDLAVEVDQITEFLRQMCRSGQLKGKLIQQNQWVVLKDQPVPTTSSHKKTFSGHV
jgi:transposase